jgi:hypothetical protein
VDKTLQPIFSMEVERQCKFAFKAYEDLNQTLIDYYQVRPATPTISYENVAQQQSSTASFKQWCSEMESYEQMRQAAKDRLWCAVQAFLVAAGNISKLLWPSYRKGEELIPERGPELRVSLGVEEDSPLAARKLRNHFEHFDMRLEKWAVSSKPRVFVDSNIGPVSMISDFKPGDRHRHFDPTTFIVYFREDTYHLRPIIEAIQAIHPRAVAKAQERAWG